MAWLDWDLSLRKGLDWSILSRKRKVFLTSAVTSGVMDTVKRRRRRDEEEEDKDRYSKSFSYSLLKLG